MDIMAKGKGNSNNGTRSTSTRTSGKTRSIPMTPKAGVTVKRRRFDEGGKA